MSGVRLEAVEPDDDGLRLDRWFRRRFPGLTHGRLEKLLRTGQVRVDGAKAKGGTRLQAGQTVRVPPFEEIESVRTVARPAPPTSGEAADLRARVLYRDDLILAIDKPAGLAVQGGTGTTKHLDGMLDALSFEARERPRLVHRLDRDTSGVLLLARSARVAAALGEAFRARTTDKRYWAIVRGVPDKSEGLIDARLAKRGGIMGERVRVDEEDGKRAETEFAVLDKAFNQASLLALRPLTGRTHQLRAHCALLETPILGDGKYGGADAFITGTPHPRMLHLHARHIVIPHPDGGHLRVEAPLPPHFLDTMRFFGFEASLKGDPLGDPALHFRGTGRF